MIPLVHVGMDRRGECGRGGREGKGRRRGWMDCSVGCWVEVEVKIEGDASMWLGLLGTCMVRRDGCEGVVVGRVCCWINFSVLVLELWSSGG